MESTNQADVQEYTFPAGLVQGIVSALIQLPAMNSRELINAIESMTQQQDLERAQLRQAAANADLIARHEAKLLSEGWTKPSPAPEVKE